MGWSGVEARAKNGFRDLRYPPRRLALNIDITFCGRGPSQTPGTMHLVWQLALPDEEILEYVCTENNSSENAGPKDSN